MGIWGRISGHFSAWLLHLKQILHSLQRNRPKYFVSPAPIPSVDIKYEIKEDPLIAQITELQDVLMQKDMALQHKDAEIRNQSDQIKAQTADMEKIQYEKAIIEAKYQKKLKAAEVKKQNLARYHERKKDTRTLKQQVEDIVGKGPKWLPHACNTPLSHIIGKPPGSSGGGRVRPELIHEYKDLIPAKCNHCDLALDSQPAYFVYDTVVTDLHRELDEVGAYDILRMKNICHRIHRKKCPRCKRWIYPTRGLFSNARFGVGFVCYVISHRILLNLTYDDILRDLRKIFGFTVKVSQTAIIDWFLKFEHQIQAVYSQLELLVKEAEFAHIDETGLPMRGENWWLWVVCTANLVLYHQGVGRGHTEIEEILKGFQGTIIADFFRAYEKFKDNPHQKCMAHLLSAIIELMVKLEKENERMTLKIIKCEAVQARLIADLDAELGKKKRGRKPKAESVTPEQLETMDQRFQVNQKTLRQASSLGTFFRQPFQDTVFNWSKPNNERISRSAAEMQLDQLLISLRSEGIDDDELENLIKRCEKFKLNLFTYLEHEEMPPDNNRAERNLRKFAKQRRISGDFKSPAVGKHLAAYLSMYMTCEANGRDFEHLLHEIVTDQIVDLRTFLFPIE